MGDLERPSRVEFSSDGPTTQHPSTRLVIDGQDLTKHARRVSVDSEPGRLPIIAVEFLAREGFRFALPAHVEPTILAYPGFELVETTAANGDTVWYARRRAEAPPT